MHWIDRKSISDKTMFLVVSTVGIYLVSIKNKSNLQNICNQ